MAQCQNREVWNSRVGVRVSYPFHTPLLKSPFHTLFHTPDLNKRFIPLLSIVSYPVSYPVSNPVKVCCRNHADISKCILNFNFQQICQSLNVQHVPTLLHTICIPCHLPFHLPIHWRANLIRLISIGALWVQQILKSSCGFPTKLVRVVAITTQTFIVQYSTVQDSMI